MIAERADDEQGARAEPRQRRVGLRELKERTSAVVRQVEQDGEAIDITRRGEVIARIVPVRRPAFDQEAFERRWAARRELARRIGEGWPEGLSAVDAVAEGREERW